MDISRKNGMIKGRGEEGAALIAAMIVLVAMTLLGFSMLTLSQIEFNIARNQSLAEEALFSAEQGCLTGIRLARQNMVTYPWEDGPIVGNSAQFTGRAFYPQWTIEVSKEGLAPQRAGGQSVEVGAEKMTAFLYRIQSEGSSRPHTVRNVECLARLWEKTGHYSLHVRAY